MELLVIVLNKEEYLERILTLLVDAGVSGATVLDSEGLGHFLAFQVSIFAGLREFMGQQKSANRTILAILEDQQIFYRINDMLKEEKIDFKQPGIGILATLPVNRVIKP
jgi:nitrogen regulatory protein P-II 1